MTRGRGETAMVAKAKSRTMQKQITKGSRNPLDYLRDFFNSRAPAEDLAAYDPAAIARATELAANALKAHKPGQSIIRIESDAGIEREGRTVTAITVV